MNISTLNEIPVKAFNLGNDVHNCNVLSLISSSRPSDIICTFIAPDTDLAFSGPEKAQLIGGVSVSRRDTALQYNSEFDTKYSHLALCMWMPHISEIHCYFAINLRFCFGGAIGFGGAIEGGKFLADLDRVAPNSMLYICTPEWLSPENVCGLSRADLGQQRDTPTDFYEGY